MNNNTAFHINSKNNRVKRRPTPYHNSKDDDTVARTQQRRKNHIILVKRKENQGAVNLGSSRESSLSEEESQEGKSKRRRPLSDFDRKEIFRNALISVHKEKMAYYKPFLDAMAERHYKLIRQAIDLGVLPGYCAPNAAPVGYNAAGTMGLHQNGSASATTCNYSYYSSPKPELENKSGQRSFVSETQVSTVTAVAVPAPEPPFEFLNTFKEQFCREEIDASSSPVFNAIRSKEGSTFVQKNMDRASQQDVTVFFNVIMENIYSLSCHFYGNYVIQKVIENCLEGERTQIFFKLNIDLKTICSNKHGTRVIQCLIMNLESFQQQILFDSMIQDILHFCTNQFAVHIVLRIMEKMINSCKLDEFVIRVQENLTNMLDNGNAIKVIAKMLYLTPERQKMMLKQELLTRIEKDKRIIASSKGYTIALELYENGNWAEKKRIFKVCENHLLEFAVHPWASLIIQAIVETGIEEEVKDIVRTLNTPQVLPRLLSNGAGAKTLQKLINVLCIPDLINMFIFIHSLKASIISKLEKDLTNCLAVIVSDPSIVDLASEFLSGGRDYPIAHQFGVSFVQMRSWMTTIFRGGIPQSSLPEIPLILLCLFEVATGQDDPGIGILKFNIRQLMVNLVQAYVEDDYINID